MAYYPRSKKSKRDTPLPDFLHNMPEDFVKHCRSRLPSERDIGYMETLGDNKFEISSFTCDTDMYYVTLGSDDTLPKCDCPDMTSTKWPCKHMLAILMYHDDGDWTDIPEKYRLDPKLMKVVPVEEQLAKKLRIKLQSISCLSKEPHSAESLRKAIRALEKVREELEASPL